MLGLAGPLFNRFIPVEAARAEADQRSERFSGLFTDLSQTGSQAATIAIALFGSLIVLQGEMTTGGSQPLPSLVAAASAPCSV